MLDEPDELDELDELDDLEELEELGELEFTSKARGLRALTLASAFATVRRT